MQVADKSFLRLKGSVREHDHDNVQYYNARRGNLVVIDGTNMEYSTEEVGKTLGDWESEVQVGYVTKIFSNEETKQTESMNISLCEPWAVDSTGKAVLPVWVAVRVQAILDDEDLPLGFKLPGVPEFEDITGTSWDEVKGLPWKPIMAVPVATWETFYSDIVWTRLGKKIAAKDQTSSFMGIPGIGAVTNLGILSGGRLKDIRQEFDYNHLLYTLQVNAEERIAGARINPEAMERMTLLGKINNLREELKLPDEDTSARLSELQIELEKEMADLRRVKKVAAKSSAAAAEDDDDDDDDDN